uniref:Uncharacterized protein n=1 Tax=Helianthus annuus TaxID=4232 RepID=A0A251S1R8_HELAN
MMVNVCGHRRSPIQKPFIIQQLLHPRSATLTKMSCCCICEVQHLPNVAFVFSLYSALGAGSSTTLLIYYLLHDINNVTVLWHPLSLYQQDQQDYKIVDFAC